MLTESFANPSRNFNGLVPLNDGPDGRAALLALLDSARTELRLLYYIFEPDDFGTLVRDRLLAARARGVTVRLILDAHGSAKAGDDFVQPLKDAGVALCRFLPRWGRRYLIRNHQKLAVADERLAMIGGFNVCEAYFDPEHDDAWRDLGLLVSGPPVAQAARYYDALFEWQTAPRRRFRRLRAILRGLSQSSGNPRWVFSGPGPRNAWSRTAALDMAGARRIDMMMAYFSPPPVTLRRLAAAARRGTAVRIVTAGRSDLPVTQHAARHTYSLLRRAGARIFEYQPRRLHAKLMIIDDIVYVGSANFDMRSLAINCELMLRVEDAALAAHYRALFEADITHSLPAEGRPWRFWAKPWRRLIWAGAYWFLASFELLFVRRLSA